MKFASRTSERRWPQALFSHALLVSRDSGADLLCIPARIAYSIDVNKLGWP